jgi:probable F420-dependent oxidoreductase
MGTDPGAIREYAEAAESLGYSHLRMGDHVLGANAASRPGWPGPYDHTHLWHEPLTLFGYLAGITEKIELVSSVLILPQRQTALVAKQAAEVDFLSGGRLRLGIGVGWNDVEYEALGEDFHSRGLRIEEQIDVMRALWTQELVTFEGRWHKITDAGLNPMPVHRPIPVWIGGGPGSTGSTSTAGTERVLRRVARKADGWFPSLGLQDGVEAVIARLHEYVRSEGRDPLDVGIEGSVSLDDQGPDIWVQRALEWKGAGATHLSVYTLGFGFTSLSQHIASMRLFQEAWSDVGR